MSTEPARRWQLTPGQRYSSAITLIIAAALMTGLGNLHGVTGNDLAGPPLELAPVAAVPDVVPTAGGPTSTPSPDARVPLPAGNVPVFPPYDTGAVPSPRAFPLSPPAPKPTVAPTTPPPGNPSPTPTPSPCAAAPVNDSAKDALTTLNGPLGGQIPQDDILAALGLVTGCSSTDPAVVAIGVLIGLGNTLPDPGLPAPPPLPYPQLPAEVVTALQPLRPALDEVCGLVGLGNTAATLFITAYPQPIPQLTIQVFFDALAVCGQVRNP